VQPEAYVDQTLEGCFRGTRQLIAGLGNSGRGRGVPGSGVFSNSGLRRPKLAKDRRRAPALSPRDDALQGARYIMFTFTNENSTIHRAPLLAATALGITFLATPSTFAWQGQSPIPAVPAVSPANPDLDAALADMAMSQTEVQQLQETLRDLGYFSGPADGRRGPATRQALRGFQTDQGLAVTGSLDPLTVTRIGYQARMVGVPNQPPSALIERAAGLEPGAVPVAGSAAIPETADPNEVLAAAVADPSAVAAAGSVDPPVAQVEPTAQAADPASAPPSSKDRDSDSSVGGALGKSGDVAADVGKATVKGVRTGGDAAVDGVTTAGKSTAMAGTTTAKAGVMSGKAVATAGTKSVDGTLYVGKSVKNGTMFLAGKTKALFVGDGGSGKKKDEQIRQSLISQYSGDDQLVASEIDVKVKKGHVTLAVPDGSLSDMQLASRIARVTPGVKSVTTVYTVAIDGQPAAEPAPAVAIPEGAPVVEPELAAPAPPEEPSSN